MASINAPPNDAKKGRNTNQLVFLRTAVMKAMMQHRHSLPFRKPVDADLLNLSDYHKIIKEPMDIGTIKSRLEKNFYWSAKDCVKDFKLVFSNCYSYNQPGEEIVANAKDLESFFLAKIADMPMPEKEVDLEAKDILVAKCSRESLGLQDYLSSYFAPSPGAEVRSRRSTQRTSVGIIGQNCYKKSRKGKGKAVRCGKKMPARVSQVGGKNPVVMSPEMTGCVEADQLVEDIKAVGEDIEVEQDSEESFSTAKDNFANDVESPPSLVSNMAHNWKYTKAAKAKQQSSANFRSRIEYTSRPFKNWGMEASKVKVRRSRLTEVSLPGMRVCALSGALTGNRGDTGVVEEEHEDEFGEHMMDKEESGQNTSDEEDLNITLGLDEERVRGAAKVQKWLEMEGL